MKDGLSHTKLEAMAKMYKMDNCSNVEVVIRRMLMITQYIIITTSITMKIVEIIAIMMIMMMIGTCRSVSVTVEGR